VGSAYPLSNATGLTAGTCIADGTCSLTANPSCLVITTYTPPPCPDACGGHGSCANVTRGGSNCGGAGQQACSGSINQGGQNVTIPPWILVCQCNDGFNGINCANAITNVPIAVGLGVAAIIGIIIAIAVVIAAVGGGGYAIAQNMATAPVAPAMNNPLYVGAGRQGTNPLHRA